MSSKTYAKALQEVLRDSDKAARISNTRTREEIQSDIDEISSLLREPLSNVDRICLCGDRRDLQNELKSLAS